MKKLFQPTPAALAVLLVFGCPAAQAAERLPAVSVTGDPSPAPAQKGIDEAYADVARTPGGASIVDMDTVRQGRVSTWMDALGLAPGVFVQERFGSEEARIAIRGSGLSRTYHGFGLRVMQDGIPVNAADGSFDMQTIDPTAARYVEVLRGANATAYGSGTLGGAINFISPTGYDAPAALFRAEAGSFGYARLQAATGKVVKPASEGGPVWDYYLSASAMRQDGFRDHSAQESEKAVGNIGAKISSELESRFFFGAVRSRSQLPGYLTKAQLLTDPTAAQDPTWPDNFQRRDVDAYRLANRTVYTRGDYQLDIAAYAMRNELWHPILWGRIRQNTDTFGGHLKLSDRSQLLGHANLLTVGYLPDFGVTDGSTDANRYRQRSRNQRFLLEDRFSLSDATTLIGSLQYHRSSRDKDDLSAQAGSYQLDYSQWLPRLGVVHRLSPDAQVFANVSRVFEPPIFDVTSTMLATRAQTGTSIEAGTRGELNFNGGRDLLSYDLTVYRAELRNEFQTVCVNQSTVCGGWQQSETRNLPRTIHQGIELGLSALLDRRWEARGVFLYSDFRFDRDPVYGNNRLPGFPPAILRGELLYRWGAGVGVAAKPASYAGPTFEWVPTRAPMDNTNSVSNDPYAIFGFKAGGPLDTSWSWFFDARNLADRKYAATTNIGAGWGGTPPSPAYYPGNGRSAYLGLEGKW